MTIRCGIGGEKKRPPGKVSTGEEEKKEKGIASAGEKTKKKDLEEKGRSANPHKKKERDILDVAAQRKK